MRYLPISAFLPIFATIRFSRWRVRPLLRVSGCMPQHSLADLTQNDWIHACLKLGLTANTQGGKGSHILIIHPSSNRKYTIQRRLHNYINPSETVRGLFFQLVIGTRGYLTKTLSS